MLSLSDVSTGKDTLHAPAHLRTIRRDRDHYTVPARKLERVQRDYCVTPPVFATGVYVR